MSPVKQIKEHAVAALIKEGKIEVVGGYYQLQSGKVEILKTL